MIGQAYDLPAKEELRTALRSQGSRGRNCPLANDGPATTSVACFGLIKVLIKNGQVGTPVLEGWWLFDVLVEVQRIASNGRLVVVMEVVVVLKHGQVHSGNPSVLFLLERGSATRF